MDLAAVDGLPLTYDEVGGTGADRLPAGYHHLRLAREIGTGPAAFHRAAETVLQWRMHTGAGARVTAAAPRAAVGVTMIPSLGIGPLRVSAPCRVVWAADDETVAGFAYGTLLGHPATGEERFTVRLAPDGRVTFHVVAFSRADRWFMRAGGPVPRLLQSLFARRCAAVLAGVAERTP